MNRIIKHSVVLVWSVVVLILMVVNPSCTKIDTPPMLEIKVLDNGGNPLEGISVGIFDELDEWSMLENPVQAWKETNNLGEVLFIDLKESIYYFFADGDSINNLGQNVQLTEALKINEKRQITVIVQ